MGNCIASCTECGNILPEKEDCTKYGSPEAAWRKLGGCAMRTHRKDAGIEEKRRIDPLKASKQKARGVK